MLSGFLGAACAAPVDDSSGRLESPISGGERDGTHHSVFGSVTLRDGFTSTCTATLIAPNLLVTARHCVAAVPSQEIVCGDSEFGEPVSPDNYIATNAVQLETSRTWFEARKMDVPSEGNDTCGFDIALVTLADNVPASVATPSIPRIDRDVALGEEYVAVGYGIDVRGNSQGRSVLEGLEVACAPGSCGVGVRVTEFRGSSGICEGDSGGPALDLDGKVVGVVSRGAEGCTDPVYGSISAWSEFIKRVAAEAAAAGGYEAPFWVESGTSDPPSAMPEPPVVEPPPSNPEPPPSNPDPPSVPTNVGTQGDPCTSSDGCRSDHACYKPSGATAAFCVEECAATSDCGSDLTCTSISGTKVYLPTRPSSPEPDPGTGPAGEAGAAGEEPDGTFTHTSKAGCTFTPTPERSSAPLAIAAACLALAFARRRRA